MDGFAIRRRPNEQVRYDGSSDRQAKRNRKETQDIRLVARRWEDQPLGERRCAPQQPEQKHFDFPVGNVVVVPNCLHDFYNVARRRLKNKPCTRIRGSTTRPV